jgi:hypothetical protein
MLPQEIGCTEITGHTVSQPAIDRRERASRVAVPTGSGIFDQRLIPA